MMPTVEPAEIIVMTTIEFADANRDLLHISNGNEGGVLSLSPATAADRAYMCLGLAEAAALWPIFKHYAETGTIADYKPPEVPDAER